MTGAFTAEDNCAIEYIATEEMFSYRQGTLKLKDPIERNLLARLTEPEANYRCKDIQLRESRFWEGDKGAAEFEFQALRELADTRPTRRRKNWTELKAGEELPEWRVDSIFVWIIKAMRRRQMGLAVVLRQN
ncbi:hypothetical protein E4U19_004330 [Claviceps sp. Clav32 group G5]|nr:hypothetical protein E4U19_004330 [Claviceps sp. Clav32 group G5]KAG6045063.1 hypothetical protein E4U39_002745 [Claviceps sp. Clav50 group G5]